MAWKSKTTSFLPFADSAKGVLRSGRRVMSRATCVCLMTPPAFGNPHCVGRKE